MSEDMKGFTVQFLGERLKEICARDLFVVLPCSLLEGLNIKAFPGVNSTAKEYHCLRFNYPESVHVITSQISLPQGSKPCYIDNPVCSFSGSNQAFCKPQERNMVKSTQIARLDGILPQHEILNNPAKHRTRPHARGISG